MSTHISVRGVGRWVLALVACALLLTSATTVTYASSYGYSDYNYGYYNNYNYSNYSYPWNYSYGSYPYQYYNYYNSYQYPTQYYPYGSHYTHGYQYSGPPSCTISISPAAGYSNDSYRWGYPMQLTWSASNATSASISPDVGSVSPSGSRVVYANGQVYSMSVYGPGGTATCQTGSYSVPFYHQGYQYNYPSSYYTYPSTYYTPTYTYPAAYTTGAANVVNNYVVGSSSKSSVTLKQIPYTGVDFGLWGTALMYLAITLAAGYAAFVLGRRKLFVCAS